MGDEVKWSREAEEEDYDLVPPTLCVPGRIHFLINVLFRSEERSYSVQAPVIKRKGSRGEGK